MATAPDLIELTEAEQAAYWKASRDRMATQNIETVAVLKPALAEAASVLEMLIDPNSQHVSIVDAWAKCVAAASKARSALKRVGA